eukprot:354070-Chlamydomonas_euryale.AAC.2
MAVSELSKVAPRPRSGARHSWGKGGRIRWVMYLFLDRLVCAARGQASQLLPAAAAINWAARSLPLALSPPVLHQEGRWQPARWQLVPCLG